MIDDTASIVPQLTETCTPPYELIEAKVDALSDKMDEMKETLEAECSPPTTTTTTPPPTITTTSPSADQGKDVGKKIKKY